MGWTIEDDQPSKWTIEDTDYQAGKKVTNPVARGLANVLNGPTFGFGDEIAGVAGALVDKFKGKGGTFSDAYRDNRDFVRGVQDQYKQDFPIGSVATQLAGSAPLMAFNPLGAGAAAIAPRTAATMANAVQAGGLGARTAQAALSGGAYGALGALGDSDKNTVSGIAGDVARGAATSAAMGGAMPMVGGAVSSVYNQVAPRISDTAAANFARQKVAEALNRDARGEMFLSGQANPGNQALARMNTLGPEARIVDAGGQNARQLLDTTAMLPGRTKNAVETAIHDRLAGRSGRLVDAADDALHTRGAGYGQTLEALDRTRKTAAAPFYDALRGVAVTVDDDLLNLINRTKGHHGEAQNLYRLATGQDVALAGVQKGQQVPFSMLDHLKQSLDDAAAAAKQTGNNKLGRAVDQARVELIEKLDDIAPKLKGESVYKMARDTYAGPSQMIEAAETGRKAMRTDAFDVAAAVREFTGSERAAFRIGALEALREKVGTQSGQTSLAKMWMEPATSSKLKAIFGNDYRAFAAEVAKEARLKGLESVGRGSQTAPRQYGAGDLDLAPLTNAASAVASGSPSAMATAAAGAWNRVKTPEPVRDQIGGLLLSRDQQTMRELAGLTPLLAAERNRRANEMGRWSGLLGNQLD